MAAKNPDAIAASKVTLRQAWLVDCQACRAGVETEEGPFLSHPEALAAKARHLAEHERGEYS